MPECPRCQSLRTEIYKTVRHATTTERSRRCLACGTCWVMFETAQFVRFVRPYHRKDTHGHQ